ncbi:hypothetical protein ACFOHS_23070 [Jhaorihella thermophila]
MDTVFCEWCCENAVWHSRNKRPGTKLIVRLHRFEAFQPFPGRVDWDKVDALIVVSEWFRDHMAGQYGIDPARIHVLPQYVDWHALRRPKLPEARFAVGLVGIAPFAHKRPDRALDFPGRAARARSALSSGGARRHALADAVAVEPRGRHARPLRGPVSPCRDGFRAGRRRPLRPAGTGHGGMVSRRRRDPVEFGQRGVPYRGAGGHGVGLSAGGA